MAKKTPSSYPSPVEGEGKIHRGFPVLLFRFLIEAFRNDGHGDIPSYTEGRFLPQLVFVFYAFIVFGSRRRLPF